MEKRNVECMTEKLNILKVSQALVMHLLSLTTSRQQVTNLKWDHFEILAKGRSDTHCKIKETLLIQELKPTLNDTVSSKKLYLY